MGSRLEEFERRVAEQAGAGHAIGVSSGTAGLHLCVIAAGVERGDLVITTPFSFVASANCALYERAVPIFVDVDPVTGNIDPSAVEAAVFGLATGGRAARRWLPRSLRTRPRPMPVKAMVPVHVFGQPADMDRLQAIARRHSIAVIEDACEAIGARYKDRQAGGLGDAGVFGFYPNKQVTTGEGGMVLTDRSDWADRISSMRNQGRDVFDAWLQHERLGYNYRLDEMSAALGVVQMSRLEEILSLRERVARWYQERLAEVPGVRIPTVVATTTRMSWFTFVVRLRTEISRPAVMGALAARGIPSRPYFVPLHLQPFYATSFGYRRGDFPVAESIGDTSLALPFSGQMTEGEVDRVCRSLAAVLDQRVSHPVERTTPDRRRAVS